jgi:hypothetical protein
MFDRTVIRGLKDIIDYIQRVLAERKASLIEQANKQAAKMSSSISNIIVI